MQLKYVGRYSEAILIRVALEQILPRAFLGLSSSLCISALALRVPISHCIALFVFASYMRKMQNNFYASTYTYCVERICTEH